MNPPAAPHIETNSHFPHRWSEENNSFHLNHSNTDCDVLSHMVLKDRCVLTLAGLVLSAQRMQLCTYFSTLKYVVDCFHMKGANTTCQKSLLIFFPFISFFFWKGSCSHFFCFPLLSKGFYSENLWMILSVDSICCTFGKVVASCKEILIGYWFRC